MKRDAASQSTRSRARKKSAPEPAASETAAETAPATVPDESTGSGPERNINSLESGLSVTAGILFLVGALFPRSIKQLLLLGMGGWLTYRGMTGRCDLYAALGIDTEKGSLLKQVNDKYLVAGASKSR